MNSSSNTSFQVFVVGENQAPEITTVLPDWVSYADYKQELLLSDPDGDNPLLYLVSAPAGMSLSFDEDTRQQFLNWPASEMSVGTHRVDLRVFDLAGGHSERTYYIDIVDSNEPVIVTNSLSHWRQNTSETKEIQVLSPVTLTPEMFVLDDEAIDRGLTIDAGGIQVEPHSSGNYSTYTVPIQWTPAYAGNVEATLSVQGVSTTYNLEVAPDVTAENNLAPQFTRDFLGPFSPGRDVFLPLDIVDPEKQEITLTVLEGSDFTQAHISDGHLKFENPNGVSGIFMLNLQATDELGASTTKEYAVVISDNTKPVIYYEFNPPVVVGEDYVSAPIVITDLDGDQVSHELEQTAIAAGVELRQVGEVEYRLIWSSANIAAWKSSNPGASNLPIQISATDNHAATTVVDFTLNVIEPINPDDLAQDLEYSIVADRQWELLLSAADSDTGLEFALAPVTGGTLPDGLQISQAEGRLFWLPNRDLLLGPEIVDPDGNVSQTLLEDREFEFQVIVTQDDGTGPGTYATLNLTVTVVNPTSHQAFTPQFEPTRVPTAVTAGEQFVFTPKLQPFAPEHQDEVVNWTLEDADQLPDGLMIDQSTGEVTWLPTVDEIGDTVTVRIRVSSSQGYGEIMSFDLDVQAINQPVFLSVSLPNSLPAGQPFEYQVQQVDPEGHELAYELLNADGTEYTGPIELDSTGTLRWDSPYVGGVHRPLIIRVSDQYNPETFADFNWEYTVQGTITAPVLDQTVVPSGSPVVGEEWTYTPQLAVPDSTVVWSLETQVAGVPTDPADLGMTIIPGTGAVSWTPDASLAGTEVSVTIRATNGSGGASTVSFDMTAFENQERSIVLPNSIIAGNELDFQIESNQDGSLQYTLLNSNGSAYSGPIELSNSGLITWTNPTLGQSNLLVRANDGVADFDFAWDFEVTAAPAPIQIDTAVAPENLPVVGRTWTFQPALTSAVPGVIWSLSDNAPAGMEIDSASGLIEWDAIGDESTVTFEITVVSPEGSSDSVSVSLELIQPDNLVISLPSVISANEAGSFQIEGISELDEPEFEILTNTAQPQPYSGPISITDDGLISWDDTLQSGQQDLLVRLQDSRGTFDFPWLVTVNELMGAPIPAIDPTVVPTSYPVAGESWSFQAELLAGFEQVDVEWSLDNESLALGMVIDSDGLITWSSPVAATTPQVVTIGVQLTDEPDAGTSYVSLTLEVGQRQTISLPQTDRGN